MTNEQQYRITKEQRDTFYQAITQELEPLGTMKKAVIESLLAQLIDLEREMALYESTWQEFTVHYIHTGKFEATYQVWARDQEAADAFLFEHRLEFDPIEVFPLSDDYEQYL